VNGYRVSDVIRATKVVRPSDFGKVFDYNDIAIFTLERDVSEEDGVIQYLDIGSQMPSIGAPIQLVGYGQLGIDMDTTIAHHSTVHVSADAPCTAFSSYAPDVAFCGYYNTKKTCTGDSGSPIFVKPQGNEERWIIIGLDSYGHQGTCGARIPDTVVAKVPAMLDFIRQNTPLAPPNFVNLNYPCTQAPVPSTTSVPGKPTTTIPVITVTSAPDATKIPTQKPATIGGSGLINVLGWTGGAAEKSFLIAFVFALIMIL
jgi:secreted trypsin-like serine protease